MGRFSNHFRHTSADVKRTGLGLWIQLVEDHFMALFWSNLVCVLCMLPAFFCFYYLVSTGDMLFLVAGIVFASLAGPGITAMHSVCLRVVHGIPVIVKLDIKESFRADWEASIGLTFIIATLWSALAYALSLIITVNNGIPAQYLLAFGVYAFLLMGFTLFSYQQLSLFDIPMKAIFKNSLLLIFAGKLRAAVAILLAVAFLVTAVIFWFYAMCAATVGCMALLVMTVQFIVAPITRTFLMEDPKG